MSLEKPAVYGNDWFICLTKLESSLIGCYEMEKSSNKEYNCVDEFIKTLTEFESQIGRVEYGNSFKCPKLPEALDNEDSVLKNVMKSWDESENKWFWALFGAGAGFFALPALGFGALGPMAGGFAACKRKV